MNIKFILIIETIIFLILAASAIAQVVYERTQPSLLTIMNQKYDEGAQNRKKIGLVLSGGGSRGLSHIGIFKGLEKNNIPIDLIVGTSIGSVIGGIYAAGYSTERMEKIMKELNWDEFFSDNTERKNLFLGQKAENDRYLMKIRFDGFRAHIPLSLTSGQKMLSFLSDKLLHANFRAEYNFDNLKIPFRAVATDLISGKRIVIGKGDLAEAINASMSVPLLFAPVEWEDMLLVDGGLRSNIAVDVAKSLGMDIIIAVDVTSPLRKPDEIRAPWEIADQATMIMMQNTYKENLKSADIIIKPNLREISGTDFTNIDFMIDEGEKSVDSLAYQIEELIRLENSENSNPLYSFNEFNLFIGDNKQKDLTSLNLNADKSNTLDYNLIKNDVDSLFSQGIYNKISAKIETVNFDTTLNYFLNKNVKIKEINIKGNNLILSSILSEQLAYHMNTTLNYKKLSYDLQKIQEFYWGTGYALMKYKSIGFKGESGILSLDIDEGRIDKIEVQGNDNTEKFVILREFPLSENNIFNSRLVKQGLENVYNTQLFERVNLILESENEQKKLIIKVKEKKYTILGIGGKVGLERGAQGYLELGNENFIGMGNKLSILTRFGDYDRNISLNFRVDRIFKSYLTLEMHGYYDWQINPEYFNEDERKGEYGEERKGVKLIIGQQLKKLGQVTAEFRLENVKDKRYSGEFSREQNSELRTLSIRSVTDKRDKIAFANSGIYNVWYWESGNESLLEGQAKYTKAFVNLEGFYSVSPSHTFHLKGIVGVADKTLPFSEWFRIGGLHSFMGLHDYEYYGRQVIDANFEYRYKLPFDFLADTYVGLRYDIGAIWEIPDLVIYGDEFFQGLGGWLGMDTIFGPLYFGYGDASTRRGVFYLSLGYDF